MQNHRHKMLAIGTMPDHVHILTGYNVNQLIPDLVEEIKTSSNTFIKGKRSSKFKFEWQKGYGAFTHSHSQIDLVAKYILSQEDHHKKRSFRDEYFEILEKNNVQFKDEYVFEFFDNYSWLGLNIAVLCTFGMHIDKCITTNIWRLCRIQILC